MKKGSQMNKGFKLNKESSILNEQWFSAEQEVKGFK